MTTALRDQAEGLRRMVNVSSVRCVGVLGPRELGLELLANALRDAWQQRGRSVLVVEMRLPVAAGAGLRAAPALPPDGADLTSWLATLPAADVILGLLDPIERAWPCIGFDEFVMVASGAPDPLTRAYAQLKALSATTGRTSCHVMFTRTPEAVVQVPMQNIQATARRFLGCVPEALGYVPDDTVLEQSSRLGLSAVETHPRAPAVRAIRAAVERLDSMAPRTHDWSAWLQRLAKARSVHASGAGR
jgi:hypothetical protein